MIRIARYTMHKKITWKAGTMIYPLPVVMVSCGDSAQGFNIMTAAWTGICCTEPPLCYISLRPERYSYQLIKKTGEFCINLTTAELAFPTDWCGVKSGKDRDKFKETGLTPIPGQYVAAPLIAESPLSLECKVKQILPLGSHDMFLAEIAAVHAAEKYVNPKTGALDLAAAHTARKRSRSQVSSERSSPPSSSHSRRSISLARAAT